MMRSHSGEWDEMAHAFNLPHLYIAHIVGQVLTAAMYNEILAAAGVDARVPTGDILDAELWDAVLAIARQRA